MAKACIFAVAASGQARLNDFREWKNINGFHLLLIENGIRCQTFETSVKTKMSLSPYLCGVDLILNTFGFWAREVRPKSKDVNHVEKNVNY